ncbi:hypothetical protein BKH43_07425 [Helicobacter sp. 13S00401-1]|nr:hypothetical protein BKH43_07425 [Helicobacter sp. 13S00401-1]
MIIPATNAIPVAIKPIGLASKAKPIILIPLVTALKASFLKAKNLREVVLKRGKLTKVRKERGKTKAIESKTL